MKYKISKEKVKRALITEPLAAGAFYSNSFNFKTCQVCAVGSILRAVDNTRQLDGDSSTNGLSYSGNLDKAYDYGNFLSKLSTEFETAAGYKYEPADSDDMRMFLLFLTEAFCPPVLEFEA